jgi:hypothetical protein
MGKDWKGVPAAPGAQVGKDTAHGNSASGTTWPVL